MSLSREHAVSVLAARVAAGPGALAADAVPGVPFTTGNATAVAVAAPSVPAATGNATAGATPAPRVQSATGDRAAAAAPRVRQMVVFRDGHALTERVSTAATTVSAGGRRCAVGERTPLAALVRSRPGRVRIRDFTACSASARAYDDAGDGVPVEGARVSGGGTSGLTAADGRVELALARGTHRLVARKDGLVRSFAELVEVP